MKSTKHLPLSGYGKGTIATIFMCLVMLLVGCGEEIDFDSSEEETAEKPAKKAALKQDTAAEPSVPKALHDDLMAEKEALCQNLIEELSTAQDEGAKLLTETGTLKLELAAAQEEAKRLEAMVTGNQAAAQAAESQAAASEATASSKLQAAQAAQQAAVSEAAAASTKLQAAQATASAQSASIKQLSASNGKLTQELAINQNRVKELEVAVSQNRNPADTLKIQQLNSKNSLLAKDLVRHQQQIKTLQTSLNNPRYHQANASMVKELTEKNTSLSKSLAKSEKKVKDLQNSLSKAKKPQPPKNDQANKQLAAQNASLRREVEKYKQQLRNQPPVVRDNIKTLPEWKTKLSRDGLLNAVPTTVQMAASVGRPHDRMDKLNSFESLEVTYIWRDSVKVYHDLEIRTVNGKIDLITYAEKHDN